MLHKKYIDKNGNEKIYEYDSKKYDKNRNKKIYNLQRMKSYYKRKGELEKVKTVEILIGLEKRRIEGEINES